MLALSLSDKFCCFGIFVFVFVFNRFLFFRFSFVSVFIIFFVLVLVFVNEFVIFSFFTIFVFVNKNHTDSACSFLNVQLKHVNDSTQCGYEKRVTGSSARRLRFLLLLCVVHREVLRTVEGGHGTRRNCPLRHGPSRLR